MEYIDKEKQLKQKTYYYYDKKGRNREKIWWYNTKEKMVTKYIFDYKNRVIREESKSKWLGHIKFTYIYDKKGKKLITSLGGSAVEKSKTNYTFNKKGFVLREDTKNLNTYVYNKKEKLIKTILHTENNWIYRDTFDKNEKMLQLKRYENGVLKDIWINSYDKYGYLLSEYQVKYIYNRQGVRELPQRLETHEYKYC
jgi:hypothetical protein